MQGPKITMVGAGGMSFGPVMANDVIRTPELAGARLVLHDVNEARLERAWRFANKLNTANRSPVVLDRSTNPAEALDGADFVISSAEIGRFEHWRQDYEIPNRYGARQIHGENGGPGAVFHSLRSITNTLGICANIERYAPDAFLVNLTNPMSRVTLAINRATRVRNVGMCHEMPAGVTRLSKLLRVPSSDIEARASGINHFTFFTEFRRRSTGEDLLPRIRELFARSIYDFPPATVRAAKLAFRFVPTGALAEQLYSPVVAHVVRTWGVVPCSVDSHIGEYLPFALDVADYHPDTPGFFSSLDRRAERLATWVSTTRVPLPLHRVGHSPEEVIPIVTSMWTGASRRLMAVNVPNEGFLPDVAQGAIVEVGATVDAEGIHPDTMPPVGDPIAGWIAPQVAIQDLIVESALQGDPDLALQALMEDPNSPADAAACRAMFEELRTLQSAALPF